MFFVARVALWLLFFKISLHRASKRVVFVLVRLVLFWLDLTCTRLVGLRAANWNISVGILVGLVSLSSSSFFLFGRAVRSSLVFLLILPCQSPSIRLALRGMFISGFLFFSFSVSRLPLTSGFGLALVLSSLPRPLSFLFGRVSLFLFCVCWRSV